MALRDAKGRFSTSGGGYNVAVGMDLAGFDSGIAAMKGMAGRVSGALGSMRAGLGHFSDGLRGAANAIFNLKNLIIGGLVAGALYKLKAGLSSVIDESTHADEVLGDLTSALQSTGNYTADAVAELDAYANARAKVTRYDDESTKAAMANLATYRMSSDEILRATKATQDLAAAKRLDLTTASDMVGKAFVGETGTLSRYGIIVDQNLSRGQKYEAVLRLIADTMGGRSEAAARTMAGRLDQLGNKWGDLKQALGDFITQGGAAGSIIDDLKDRLAGMEQWFADNKDTIQGWADVIVENVDKALRDFGDDVQTFISEGGLLKWLYAAEGGYYALASAIYRVKAALELMQAGGKSATAAAEEALRSTYEQIAADAEAAGQHEMAQRLRAGEVEANRRAVMAERSGLEPLNAALDSMKKAEEAARKMRDAFARIPDAAIKWKELFGGGPGLDAQARALDRAFMAPYADQDVARTKMVEATKRRMTELTDWVTKAYGKETDALQSELGKQLSARESAVKDFKAIQQKGIDDAASWQERVNRLMSKGLEGPDLARREAKMARYYQGLMQQALGGGEFERARDLATKAQEHAEKVFETADTRRGKRGAAQFLEQMEKARRGALGQEEQTARGKVEHVQGLIDELRAKLENLHQEALAKLELSSNVPEVSAQVDALRAKLDAIHDKTITITTKYSEEHAGGGWVGGGMPGRDSVPALLTPGEFVVNARAAALHQGLLERLNSGLAFPSRFARGGAVGGSVADQRTTVNVTFNGPGDRAYIRNTVIPGIEQAVRRGRAGSLNRNR